MNRILILLAAALTALMTVAAPIAAQEVNLTAECVTDYDETVNYFPEQAEVEYATGWTVDYFDHYKIVTVTQPFPGATEADAVEYVLVQCGTPAPEGFDPAQIIDVPVQRVITLSTTYLPTLTALDLLPALVGVDNFDTANSPQVRDWFESGDLVEVGSGATINVERVLEAAPDLVLAYASGFAEYDAHPVLQDAGVFVALNAEFAETSPLARAEWLKFNALFFNAEGAAEAFFDAEAALYNELAALTADIPDDEKPLVLWDAYSTFGEAWYVPGENAYSAQLLRSAGARIVLGDAPEVAGLTGSVPFDFETVYDAGTDADVWLVNLFGVATLDDLLAQDERYADLRPFQDGAVYNNDGRINEFGYNDYFETAVAQPSGVLADLIAIFHPDRLPDHDLIYFRRME